MTRYPRICGHDCKEPAMVGGIGASLIIVCNRSIPPRVLPQSTELKYSFVLTMPSITNFHIYTYICIYACTYIYDIKFQQKTKKIRCLKFGNIYNRALYQREEEENRKSSDQLPPAWVLESTTSNEAHGYEEPSRVGGMGNLPGKQQSNSLSLLSFNH